MADNFEQLGFQVKVDGADSAVSNLDRVIQRLERIAKLQSSTKNANKSVKSGGLATSSQIMGDDLAKAQAKGQQDNYKLALKYARQLAQITDPAYKKVYDMGLQVKAYKKQIETSNYLSASANEEANKSTESNTTAQNKNTEAVNKNKTAIKNKVNVQKKEQIQTEKNTKSLRSYITKLTTVVAVARKLGHFVVDAVNESAKYIENLNLFAVAFGDTYRESLKWALEMADAYGLASNEVVRFAGTFRELSTSLGLVEDTADNVSETVTKLGYDLAALYNTTVEQAMEKLQSGIFSGNVRPLRSFGIDISQNQIDALFETNQALAQMGVNARDLSQSDKVIARLIIALQSGTDAFGTMYREINNLQSQFRIFQGSLQNFKLAIGDLVQKPIANAMVYINAFIIAMTDIIRTFVPLKTIDETPVGNLGVEADEASEALDNLNGKLADFDKFNVLGGQSSKNNQLTITEQLNKLLEEQIELYENRLTSAMEAATNKATTFATKIRDWFVVVDEEGKFVEWTNNAKVLGTVLTEVGLILAYVFGKKMVTSMVGFFTKYVTHIQELRLQNALATTSFQKLQVALSSVITGILTLTMGIVSLVMNWNSMSEAAKYTTIFVSLAAAIGAAAAALYLFKQNYAMAIGVGATVLGTGLMIGSQLGTMTKHADGGYTNANLIMTHENGKREWVGKAAGSSAIVNDTQMSDIMEVAVAKGVYRAMSAEKEQGRTSGSGNKNIYKFYMNGREILMAFEEEAGKQGKFLSSNRG